MRARILALGLLLCGCGAEIGDECTSSSDCSPDGDRICDRAQEGGYCTARDCTADDCPDDALCVQFGAEPRFERHFCMAECGSESDCRGGYSCVRPEDNDSLVVDQHRSGRYCVQSSE